jgi:hypothetical protein
MKKGSSTGELRIVDQIRTMDHREYDLACQDARLTVNVSETKVDGVSGWRVEARARRFATSALVTVIGTGETRTQALRAVGRSMRESGSSSGLSIFDWESIEKLLVGVRAL